MKKLAILALVLLSSIAVRAQILTPSPQFVNAASSGITDCGTGECASWTVPAPSVGLTSQVTGTMTNMTLTAECTSDSLTWQTCVVRKLSDGTLTSTTTATGQFAIPNTGLTGFRWRCTAYVSGGANITLTRGAASAANRSDPAFPASFTIGDLLYASSSTAISGLADVAVGQVLVSGGVGVAPAYSANPSFTSWTTSAADTANVAGIAATATDGIILNNATAATSGVPVQRAPRLKECGTAWKTDATTASQTDCWAIETRPVSAAGATTSVLAFSASIDSTTSFTDRLTLTSAGAMTLTGGSFNTSGGGNITATGEVLGTNTAAAATGYFYWTGRSRMLSPADGVVNMTNAAGTSFTSLQMVGDIILNASTPTISSGCGTTPAAPVGNSSAFQVTVGAGGDTSCVIAFGTAFTNTPHCAANDRSTANLMRITTAATTGVTVSGVMVAGDVIDVICMGHWQ